MKEEKPEGILGNTEPHMEPENSGKRLQKLGSVKCMRTRRPVWEVGKSETTIQRAQHRNAVSRDPLAPARPGQRRVLLPHLTPDPEAEDPSCFLSAETQTEILQLHAESRLGPVAAEGAGDKLSALSSLQWDSKLVPVDFVPVEDQAGTFEAWSEEGLLAQNRLYSKVQDKDDENALPENVSSPCARFTERVGEEFTTESKYTTGCAPFEHLTTSTNHSVQDNEVNEFQQGTFAEERPYSCTQCGKTFAKLHYLKGHLRVHTGEKPFACEQCEKRFSYHHQLTMHRRIHTGEKPFVCAQCGKRFTQSSHIKRHQAVHTGEKRFGCTLCGKRFSQSCGLKSHQAVHTRQRLFGCSQCGKGFSILGNLLKHKTVHSGK